MNCDKEMKIFSKRSSEITVMVALWLARWALEFDVKGSSPDQICLDCLRALNYLIQTGCYLTRHLKYFIGYVSQYQMDTDFAIGGIVGKAS